MTRVEWSACLALFVTGLYATAFGPAMTTLADDFGVSVSRAGLLLTFLFLGSAVASTSMASVLRTYDARRLMIGGVVGAGAGCLVLGLANSWTAALLGATVLGLGDGFLVAGAHTVAARQARDVAPAINRINVAFAIGAVSGPLWAGAVLAFDGSLRAVVFAGIALAAVAAATFAASTGAPRRETLEQTHEADMDRTAWLMAVVLFLYVGAELGLGSWVATYSEREFGAGIFAGALVSAGYWGALMVGRVVSGRLFRAGAAAAHVLAWSVAGGLVFSTAVAAANGVFAVAVVAALATGLAFGPIWPSAMAVASERGSTAGVPAALVTIGNSGGFVFPFLQGQLLVEAGPAAGMGLSALLCVGMLTTAWFTLRGGQSAR